MVAGGDVPSSTVLTAATLISSAGGFAGGSEAISNVAGSDASASPTAAGGAPASTKSGEARRSMESITT
jgi:hypothetical protein